MNDRQRRIQVLHVCGTRAIGVVVCDGLMQEMTSAEFLTVP